MKRKYIKYLSWCLMLIMICTMMLTMVSCGNHKITKEQEVEGTFENISISANKEANITIEPSPDGKVKVVAVTHKKVNCDAKIEGTTLFVNIEDPRNWFGRVLEFHSPKVTVYIPAGEYVKLQIDTTTGNTNVSSAFSFETISIEGTTGNITCNASAKNSIDIRNTTGDVTLNNVTTNTLNIKITTGKIALNNVITSGKMSLKTTTGNIRFNGCDGAEIYATATTGSIKGTLLSPKIFLTSSRTGKVNVPHTASGGICDLSTTTGKIDISIK